MKSTSSFSFELINQPQGLIISSTGLISWLASEVGSFGNYLIKQNSKYRTYEPVFNHLVFGKKRKLIFNCNTDESFGNNSVFSIMEKYNFKILCFCCSPSNMTLIHYIEKKMNVKYRYDKYFVGYIKNKNKRRKITLKYHVGKKQKNYKDI